MEISRVKFPSNYLSAPLVWELMRYQVNFFLVVKLGIVLEISRVKFSSNYLSASLVWEIMRYQVNLFLVVKLAEVWVSGFFLVAIYISQSEIFPFFILLFWFVIELFNVAFGVMFHVHKGPWYVKVSLMWLIHRLHKNFYWKP